MCHFYSDISPHERRKHVLNWHSSEEVAIFWDSQRSGVDEPIESCLISSLLKPYFLRENFSISNMIVVSIFQIYSYILLRNYVILRKSVINIVSL